MVNLTKSRNKMTKRQIEEQISKLRKKLHILEEKEIREKINPQLLTKVGKFYVYYGNTYGGDSDKWNVYKRIIDAVPNKDGMIQFITEEFQLISDGTCEYKIEKHYTYPDGREPFSGYVECSAEEYIKYLNEFWIETRTQSKIRNEIKSKD